MSLLDEPLLDDLFQALSVYDDLLFDLDNTLFPTTDYDRGAFADIAALYPDTQGLCEYLTHQKQLQGARYARLFDDAVTVFKLPLTTVATMVQCYHNHNGRFVQTDPSYIELLRKLQQRGHRLFIISNGRPRIQQCKLRRLEFSKLFTEICICDGSAERPLKPDPHMFIALNDTYHLNKPVMIGDTPEIDGQFAHACNIPFLHHCYHKE